MTKMLEPSQFDRIFGSLDPFPYNRSFTQNLEASRRSLEGFLFIDRVLKALNLSKGTISHLLVKSSRHLNIHPGANSTPSTSYQPLSS